MPSKQRENILNNSVTAIDIALSLTVLVFVGLTMVLRSRKAQVMAFLGLGVVLSLVWFRLSNLDISLAEAALGSSILSAVLVALVATNTSRESEVVQQQQQAKAMPRWLSAGLGLSCGVVLTLVLGSLLWRVDQQMPQWQHELSPAMSALPVEHGITGVLLSFRAYDTLLESAVLMFAALIAHALLPEGSLNATARGSGNGPSLSHQFSFSWAFRLLAPILLLLGLWILFAGTSGPGGAFQSGTVIVGMLIMLHLAQVRLEPFIRYWLVPLVMIGVGVFILASVLGPLMSQPWFTWPNTAGYAIILTVEISLTAGIAAALFLLYLAAVQSAHQFAPQQPATPREASS